MLYLDEEATQLSLFLSLSVSPCTYTVHVAWVKKTSISSHIRVHVDLDKRVPPYLSVDANTCVDVYAYTLSGGCVLWGGIRFSTATRVLEGGAEGRPMVWRGGVFVFAL